MRHFICRKNSRHAMKKLVPLIAMSALSACGFHLKGTYAYDHLPEQKWYISGGQLQKPLENAIRHASGKPVAQSQAQAELRVTSFDNKRDIYTITRAAKLNEYLFTLRVTAQAYRNNQPWGAPLVAHVRRNMPYSDGLTLGKDEETATIWRDMYNDAADQIVRQLGFLNQSSPSQPAAPTASEPAP